MMIITKPMSFLPPHDYKLQQLLGDNPQTSIWLAEQESVNRRVVLEQWHDLRDPARAQFIASVRAKASIDHPLIASVYEAIDDEKHCLFTREWLPGDSLAAMIAQQQQLKPAIIANLLRRLAEAQMYLEDRSTATRPLSLSHMYLSEHQVLRIANLAIAGQRSAEESFRDIQTIGHSLLPLMEPQTSGYTRVQTLLHWMTGKDPENIVRWKEIRHYADQIEQQLATPIPSLTSTTKAEVNVIKKRRPFGLIITASAAIVLIGIWFVLTKKPRQPVVVIPPLNGPIFIPEGSYPGPNGSQVKIRKFWLSSHEVTIGEYHDFLSSLEVLDDEQRKIYDHEAQPANKTSHMPEDWPAIFAAADKGLSWNQLPLTLHCPVFGIDWWDAHAYCEWKRGRLPTQEEWHAAMRWKTADPLAMKPGSWTNVSQLDCNGSGFFGMAGGVSEWTRKPTKNPINPLGERQWVIMGASYLHPQQGAQTRKWTNDRNFKSNDLGFRIAFDHLPE